MTFQNHKQITKPTHIKQNPQICTNKTSGSEHHGTTKLGHTLYKTRMKAKTKNVWQWIDNESRATQILYSTLKDCDSEIAPREASANCSARLRAARAPGPE